MLGTGNEIFATLFMGIGWGPHSDCFWRLRDEIELLTVRDGLSRAIEKEP